MFSKLLAGRLLSVDNEEDCSACDQSDTADGEEQCACAAGVGQNNLGIRNGQNFAGNLCAGNCAVSSDSNGEHLAVECVVCGSSSLDYLVGAVCKTGEGDDAGSAGCLCIDQISICNGVPVELEGSVLENGVSVVSVDLLYLEVIGLDDLSDRGGGSIIAGSALLIGVGQGVGVAVAADNDVLVGQLRVVGDGDLADACAVESERCCRASDPCPSHR